MHARGGGAESLRRHNAAAVLRALRDEGPGSRAELATRTGLAKATVGTIVGTLVDAGTVREFELVRSGDRGRPGQQVTLAGGRPVGVGFEVNVEYVTAVVLDLSGAVRAEFTRPIAPGADLGEALAALAGEVVLHLKGVGLRAVGATVAVPGLIAEDDRTVVWTPNLPLAGTDVAALVDEAFAWHDRARVNNDADCAALAELHHGAGRDTDHLLYLTGTVGIGAGVVDGGRLVRGGRGFAGEVGHLPLGAPDAACGCGRRGCWEASIGLHAMLAQVGMAELSTPDATATAVAEAARSTSAVQAGLDEVGAWLGRGLAVVCGPTDPAVVVLGGYFEPLGELVLATAREVLAASFPSPHQRPPELRVGSLGTGAAALGAAERALLPLFDGVLEIP